MIELKKIIKKNIDYIIAFISIIIVSRITITILKKELFEIDMSFYQFIVNSIRNKYLTYFMKFITILGSSKIIILLTLIMLFAFSNKKLKIFITLNPILIVVINQLLKNIVARKRPTEFFLIVEKGFSFPSGHAMVSTACYGLLMYLIYKYTKKTHKNILMIMISILILLIMFSRIYLGVHYLSDVVVGCLISIIYLIIYIRIMNRCIRGEVYEK